MVGPPGAGKTIPAKRIPGIFTPFTLKEALGTTKIRSVSRTIADLEGEEDVLSHHLSEAIHYRSLDRESWGA